MKRFIITLILLLAICGAFFYALSWPRGLGGERATGGVLDLMGADFSQTRHNLNGEWEFYFGALYTPEDFANGAVSGGTLINVPGSWTDGGFPRYGDVTYRLVVKTNEPSLMMFIPSILNASAVWIDGEKVFSAGAVGEQTLQAVGVRNAFVSFYLQDSQAEIIVQASNYTWFASGITTGMEVGISELIINNAFFRRVLLGIFIGILVAMFVYQLFLFSQRRKDRAHLAFALFCVVTAVRFAMETNGIAMLFGNYGHIHRSVFQIFITLKVVGLVSFTHLAFEIPVGKIRLSIYAVTLGIPILTAFPFGVIDMRIIFIPIVPLVMMFFSALRSKRLHDNYYNYLYLIVYFIYCIAQPIERFVLDGQLYMPAAAHNLLMVLTQFFMLSLSFSQAKEAEQRLATENAALDSLSSMKTDFLNDIKHEVRNPLQVISLGTDVAHRYFGNAAREKEGRAALSTIQNEAVRLGRMIDGMVELATESGGGVNRQRTDFAKIIRTCAENSRLVLEQKKNALRVEIAADLPHVYVEAEQIKRVPVNLIINAANSTENGEITVTATADESYVTVKVRDTGEGIPPDLMPRIFERGVSGKGGKGYGLSICKTIVEAHGGAIKIESEPGAGTCVIFTIPVYGGQSESRGGEVQ